VAENSDAIKAKIAELKDLLVEDGMDANTADALLFAVQPSDQGTIVGNLADLQRMGAIAVTGEIPQNAMPEGDQDAIETTNIQDAFAEPPAQPTQEELDAQAGVSPGTANRNDEAASDTGDSGDGSVDMTMTKDELVAEANNRGVAVDDSMTKQQIIDAINNG